MLTMLVKGLAVVSMVVGNWCTVLGAVLTVLGKALSDWLTHWLTKEC